MIYLFDCNKCKNYKEIEGDICSFCNGCNELNKICKFKCSNSNFYCKEDKKLTKKRIAKLKFHCNNYKEKGSQ